MALRRKDKTESEPAVNSSQTEDFPNALHANKYGIRFEILPEISYLDAQLCRLIAGIFPLCKGFPEQVWLSQEKVEEGLDSCSVNFWAFSKEPESIKEFSIWFGGFFREASVSQFLEHFVEHALEKAGGEEVILANWSRIHVTEDEVRAVVKREMEMSDENISKLD